MNNYTQNLIKVNDKWYIYASKIIDFFVRFYNHTLLPYIIT